MVQPDLRDWLWGRDREAGIADPAAHDPLDGVTDSAYAQIARKAEGRGEDPAHTAAAYFHAILDLGAGDALPGAGSVGFLEWAVRNDL